MFKKIKSKRGFTLIEMLIAMSVFVMFMGVVIQSYLGIVRSQQETNEYRVMYSEARYIFDKFSDEVRNGNIYYKDLDLNEKKLVLISSDGNRAVKFSYDKDKNNLRI
jgi:prepilin-type N-terminal cleavage/methylation domain-containing protein